jgi:hypothetical protein
MTTDYDALMQQSGMLAPDRAPSPTASDEGGKINTGAPPAPVDTRADFYSGLMRSRAADQQQAARAAVVSAQDANPDVAGRAARAGQALGLPATAVEPNIEAAEQQARHRLVARFQPGECADRQG